MRRKVNLIEGIFALLSAGVFWYAIIYVIASIIIIIVNHI